MIKHKWLLLLVLTVAGFLLDWYTKFLADSKLPHGYPVSVLGDYFQLLLVYNKGAIFGINPRELIPSFPVNIFFTVFTVFAIVFLVLYYRALKKNEILMHWGLALVLPGAFGNMYDRIFYADKGVVDFIRIGIPPDTYWFIFNVADVFVTVGVILMLIHFVREGNYKESPLKEKNAAGNEASAE
ncbi:MAG: signal peptidase II [Chitinispirillaceae bacterium]